MTRAALAPLVAALMVTASLAGCIGAGEEADLEQLSQTGMTIQVSPEQGDTDTNFTFDASETPGADELTFHWDFDDGTNATGTVVDHTFPWTNNLYEVTVTASNGTASVESTVEVPVGTGVNTAPTVTITREKPWVAHGEELTMTADASDGDGDPLEIVWLQAKKQEQGGHHGGDDGHDHGHGGQSAEEGDSYGIPEPTGKTGETATFTFEESGTYKLVAKAEDPKGATATASLEIKVTRTVPKPTFTLVESGELTAGTAAGQTGISGSEIIYETQQPSQNTHIDAVRYDIRLIYPGEGTFSLNWSGAAGAGPADLDLFLQDGNGDNIVARDDPDPTSSNISTEVDLAKGSYTILVRANAGAQIPYTVTLDLDLEIPGLTVDVGPNTASSEDSSADDGHDHEH